MSESTMRGRLDIIPLLELLSALARSRKSGTLRFHSSSQSVDITLEQGSVRSVSTDDETLRIGQVLMRLGLINEEQLEQALALQSIAADPERVGEVLIDIGYISETDISEAMTVQIQTALNVMLDDDDRQFAFVPAANPCEAVPLCKATLDPLVLTVADLTEHWLSRFTQRVQVETENEYPLDREALEILSEDQQELIERLIIAYHRLGHVIAERNRHAHRVQRSVKRLLKHVLVQIVDGQRSRRARKRQLEYRVQLVDRTVDLWSLADLSRSARALLLCVLNGETRLAALIEHLRSTTDSPSSAVQELVSNELISFDSEPLNEPEESRDARETGDLSREMIYRLLP
jgi:hypothetical protein